MKNTRTKAINECNKFFKKSLYEGIRRLEESGVPHRKDTWDAYQTLTASMDNERRNAINNILNHDHI